MSKKLVSFDGGKENVTTTFDENTTARSDIPVGADGTHSAVRHRLYRAFSLVDTIQALDHIGYPGVLHAASDAHYVIGDKDLPYISDDQAKLSDWTTQDNKKMMDEIRHFMTLYGTLGDLIDVTRIERVSKVFFEGKQALSNLDPWADRFDQCW
ncbi:hypothetical protein BGZ97_003339 [Linnemannia gamsii]|uniref:FAD-binding domain-containing protein n=1 Tax=Linnemannia gamsii TaxID=64522 RepID=A0A9P6QTF2_9FUNG|nr:hypothetical protein BGZ97_003339 [Linnemannia gamsii]